MSKLDWRLLAPALTLLWYAPVAADEVGIDQLSIGRQPPKVYGDICEDGEIAFPCPGVGFAQ